MIAKLLILVVLVTTFGACSADHTDPDSHSCGGGSDEDRTIDHVVSSAERMIQGADDATEYVHRQINSKQWPRKQAGVVIEALERVKQVSNRLVHMRPEGLDEIRRVSELLSERLSETFGPALEMMRAAQVERKQRARLPIRIDFKRNFSARLRPWSRIDAVLNPGCI